MSEAKQLTDGKEPSQIRRWKFQAFTTIRRNNKPFDEQIFIDHTEMKVFSANHSAKYKPTFPLYWSTYFEVNENGHAVNAVTLNPDKP